jgi:hypothetical protein
MSICHSSKLEQKDQGIDLSRNSNNSRRIVGAIALRLKSVVSSIWDFVFTPASNEPIVSQGRDRSGQIYWRVYDPVSDRSIRFSSEQEVRQWLEQRFYTH